MHSRPDPTFLTAPYRLTMSGKAAYSSKKELAFLQSDSDAGIVAGVFFSPGLRIAPGLNWLKCCIDEEMQQFSWCRIH